jgi:signal transduction histidine kinase
MGMQSSDELREVVLVINEQLQQLHFDSKACNIIILDKKTGDATYWVSGFTKDIYPVSYHVPYLDHPYYKVLLNPWKKGEPYAVYSYEGAEKKNFDKRFFSETGFKNVPAGARKEMMGLPFVTLSTAYFANGAIQVLGPEALSDEKALILRRFAKVFDQTYTRFLDLKKAEIQAREAQIELGLEKVRTRAMAMQRSSELSDLVDTVFQELTKLDFALNWCIINIIDAPGLCNTVWAANVDTGKPPESYHMLFEDYPFHDAMMQGYLDRASRFIYTLEGEEKKVYDEYLFSQTEFRKVPEEAQAASRAMEKYVCSFTFSNFGGLQTVGSEPLSDSNLDILERFGKVFDLTYTRFNDLLNAEAQARVAQIETALERVRSRTMAMQHSDELAEASHLLDKEVRGLGIKTWGCAFNIYREKDSIEWFGNEAGLLPTYTVPRQGIFKEYFDLGQKGESLFINEIAGEECTAHYEFMSTLPVVGDVLRQLKKTNGSFPSYQIDHVAYFKYGYLLFITREEVPEAHEIFKRFAKVFEQTYTRFLDLQLKEEQAVKLVAEKRRLEKTLSDLQATQKQLIHAEKMASLGELTAGIAHEIQNPLNFVNNFSEVSRELLEELMQELKNGDTEEVDAIAQDVIQNLEKINHHGKRADSIVKGMLQHSRSGKGEKEPANLNALADEYLRLAFHGLRAKDNSFNATMVTDYDDAIGLVEVVPQDIGRVLLNLYTNAFHAVNEKKGTAPADYEPTIWVASRKTAEGAEISVRDNGSGIPDAIRDKIFQPFFTTKPTGEGTGLGLSMSYDIITKGHGGDLVVSSTQEKGTTFTISLPFHS